MARAKTVFLAMPLLLSSCHDLGAISSISGHLTDASSAWDDVGDGLKTGCQRTMAFDALLDCTDDVTAAQGIAAADAVLRGYFTALGDAANGQNFSVQPGLDALSGSVAKIPGINSSEVGAASGLAGFLVSLGTEVARERTIRQLIARVPQAKAVTAVLERTVSGAATQTLHAEQIQSDAVFKTYILSAGTPVPAKLESICAGSGPPSKDFSGPTFLLATEYCRRLATIAAETTALANYNATLAAADNALDDLASSQSDLRGKALFSHLYTLGTQLDSDVAAVKAAFAPGASA